MPIALVERARARAISRLRRALAPDEVVHNVSGLLDWPAHSYAPPTLLRFGHEPGEAHVTVGNYCSINGGTRILLGGHHHSEWVSTYPFRIKEGLPGAYEDGQPFSRGPVTLGSDVWIGYDVVILSGVTIGHGAVVGAGSLVTRDVPPFAIAAGNPASVRRYRFDDDTIAALLEIAWWDWPHERVLEASGLLQSPNIGAFIAAYGVSS